MDDLTMHQKTREAILRNNRIKLDWLYVFYLVVKKGSFTSAADELDITDSSISQVIKKLSSALGEPLFVKNGRKTTPTKYAIFLFQNIKEHIEGIYFSLTENDTIKVTMHKDFLFALSTLDLDTTFMFTKYDDGCINNALEFQDADVIINTTHPISNNKFVIHKLSKLSLVYVKGTQSPLSEDDSFVFIRDFEYSCLPQLVDFDKNIKEVDSLSEAVLRVKLSNDYTVIPLFYYDLYKDILNLTIVEDMPVIKHSLYLSLIHI
ncbi:LysR family transcriptional regulator, partial [Vibrio mediterranei]|nr:LysR family transcriptional regulator [Vibrio mediterranei]